MAHPLSIWLEENNTSQAALGERASVPQSAISNYLLGNRGLSVEAIESISSVTGISRDVLMFESPKRQKDRSKPSDTNGGAPKNKPSRRKRRAA